MQNFHAVSVLVVRRAAKNDTACSQRATSMDATYPARSVSQTNSLVEESAEVLITCYWKYHDYAISVQLRPGSTFTRQEHIFEATESRRSKL